MKPSNSVLSSLTKNLFADNAIQIIFHLAKGLPRVINQIALQTLIQAAIRRVDTIDENFLKQHVLNNSLFDNTLQE
jgi:type II secretory pathway predicted ATPase ExeA